MKKYGKIFALILIIVVIWLSPLSKYFNINHALNVFEQIKANPLAPLIFVMIYATGVVFFLPGLPMTLDTPRGLRDSRPVCMVRSARRISKFLATPPLVMDAISRSPAELLRLR